jgi:N-acetylglutamate synthase-like GNAT family acetyltransferase
MNLRKAKSADVKIINSLNKQYFGEKGRNWLQLITSDNSEVFVLEDKNKIIGWTGIIVYRWNNTARIIDIFIHPSKRNKGLGKTLVQYIKQYAQKKKVRSLIAEAPSLNPVLSLYLKSGFRICGYNDRYYDNKGKEMAVFLSFDFNKKDNN